MVPPGEGNEARGDGRRGVGVSHSTAEAGELSPRDPVEGRGHRQVAPLEGKTANTPRLGPVSTSRQRIAELARQALGMAVAIAWLPGPAGTRRRVAKLSVEEPDAAEPARPDLWGARVSNDPGLPDLLGLGVEAEHRTGKKLCEAEWHKLPKTAAPIVSAPHTLRLHISPILSRHPHDQLPDLVHDTRASGAAPAAAVVFLRDESPMPASSVSGVTSVSISARAWRPSVLAFAARRRRCPSVNRSRRGPSCSRRTRFSSWR